VYKSQASAEKVDDSRLYIIATATYTYQVRFSKMEVQFSLNKSCKTASDVLDIQ